MVVRREWIEAGFEKMTQCCGSLTSLEYFSFAKRLSLEGSSDEAAAGIANHVQALGVWPASVSAGMGAVLPSAAVAADVRSKEQPNSPISQP
jgi:hypothetical protein